MAVIGGGVYFDARPFCQCCVCVVQTRCDELVCDVVADAEHEEVADVFDVWRCAIPEAPEDVGEGTQGGEVRLGGGFAARVPERGGGGYGALEEEAEYCWGRLVA